MKLVRSTTGVIHIPVFNSAYAYCGSGRNWGRTKRQYQYTIFDGTPEQITCTKCIKQLTQVCGGEIDWDSANFLMRCEQEYDAQRSDWYEAWGEHQNHYSGQGIWHEIETVTIGDETLVVKYTHNPRYNGANSRWKLSSEKRHYEAVDSYAKIEKLLKKIAKQAGE